MCDSGVTCILQELCPDGDLFGLIDPAYGVPAIRAAAILRDVAAALRYCHDPCIGMVHMDIKAENVLLAANGTAKLCDFDTAALLGSSVRASSGG